MKFSFSDPAKWIWRVYEEFELLRVYTVNVENQLETGLINFVKSRSEVEIEEAGENGNPGFSAQIRVYDGLDDSTWSTEEVFGNYFPSLHRRSCSITIYSFLEHILENLCGRYAGPSALQITTKDLKGTGIDRSRLYLRKVIGLDLSSAEKPWNKVKNFQKIRNCIVHNDGYVTEGKYSDVIKRTSYVHLQGNELILEKVFLEYALTCFEDFCKAVYKSVEAQNNKSKLTQPPTSDS